MAGARGPAARKETSLYWLQRAVEHVRLGGWRLSYREFAVVLPVVIVAGHFAIASFTNGLDKFLNDGGLLLTAAAWCGVLLAIQSFVRKLDGFGRSVQNLTGSDTEARLVVGRILSPRSMAVSGILAAVAEMGILAFYYNPLQYVTGFREPAYAGPVSLAMKYTSVPAYLWTNFFWAFLFFVLGNCAWLCMASIVEVTRKLTDKEVVELGLASDAGGHVLSLGRSTILSGALTLLVPLVFLAPMAAADASNTLLLPRLAGIYEVLALAFVGLLALALGSSYLVRRRWDRVSEGAGESE